MDAPKLKRGKWYLLERVLPTSRWNKSLRETRLVQILSRQDKSGFYSARVIDTGEEIRLTPHFYGVSKSGSPATWWGAKVPVGADKVAYKHFAHCFPQTEIEVGEYIKSNHLRLESDAAQTFRERVVSWLRHRKFW